MSVTFGGEVKTYRDMKTEIKNFPRGLDVKDLLYLIWRALCDDKSGGSEGGSSGGGCSCLSPMFVAGTIEDGEFVPGEGAATWEEAHEQMFNGGLVYLVETDDGEPVAVFLASMANAGEIGAPNYEGMLLWNAPGE